MCALWSSVQPGLHKRDLLRKRMRELPRMRLRRSSNACMHWSYIYTWDLSLGIETLEEVRRKGYNTGRVVRRLTYVRIRTMGGSVRSLHRDCTDSLRDVVMRSV